MGKLLHMIIISSSLVMLSPLSASFQNQIEEEAKKIIQDCKLHVHDVVMAYSLGDFRALLLDCRKKIYDSKNEKYLWKNSSEGENNKSNELKRYCEEYVKELERLSEELEINKEKAFFAEFLQDKLQALVRQHDYLVGFKSNPWNVICKHDPIGRNLFTIVMHRTSDEDMNAQQAWDKCVEYITNNFCKVYSHENNGGYTKSLKDYAQEVLSGEYISRAITAADEESSKGIWFYFCNIYNTEKKALKTKIQEEQESVQNTTDAFKNTVRSAAVDKVKDCLSKLITSGKELNQVCEEIVGLNGTLKHVYAAGTTNDVGQTENFADKFSEPFDRYIALLNQMSAFLKGDILNNSQEIDQLTENLDALEMTAKRIYKEHSSFRQNSIVPFRRLMQSLHIAVHIYKKQKDEGQKIGNLMEDIEAQEWAEKIERRAAELKSSLNDVVNLQ